MYLGAADRGEGVAPDGIIGKGLLGIALVLDGPLTWILPPCFVQSGRVCDELIALGDEVGDDRVPLLVLIPLVMLSDRHQ